MAVQEVAGHMKFSPLPSESITENSEVCASLRSIVFLQGGHNDAIQAQGE